MPRVFTPALVLVVVILPSLARGLEPAEIEPLLKRPILGADVPLADVQRFVERRVPLLTTPDSRETWERQATAIRQRVLDEVVFRGEARNWRDAEVRVEWLDTIEGGPEYRIRKLRYEALPGMWIPALLYEPTELSGKRPVVMNVNGHDGAGKAAPYKQIRCINQAKRGMLALNVEWLGMGQLRGQDYGHYRMNQLDLCGTSGLAPFYLSMKRGLDVLLAHENADPARVAVAGLSGGGWQTIFISSLDTRVTLANPVAGYSSFFTRIHHFKDLGDSEQTPTDLATVADYTHLTALLAPRAALLTYNSKDNCCFESGYALPPLLKAAQPIYRLYDQPDRLRSHVNDDPGTHNFERENREALYAMIGDHFYRDQAFDATEIESRDEVKTRDELDVALPDDNHSFHSLANKLRSALPRQAALPDDPAAAQWQAAQRDKLRSLVRARATECTGESVRREEQGDVVITHWKLKIGDDWTVPAVEFQPAKPRGATIVLSEQGRESLAEPIARLLKDGQRVLAVDPFYFGESKISQRDFLFALLVATVGERPLGIQAGQLQSIAHWFVTNHGLDGVGLESHGPRSGTIALVAAALDPEAIRRLNLHGSLASLHQVVERNHGVNEMPEMFCFGLLEAFDLPQLAALAAPCRVTVHGADERTRTLWQPLRTWYERQRIEHDPLPAVPSP